MTHTWQITNLKRNLNNGLITTASYFCSTTYGKEIERTSGAGTVLEGLRFSGTKGMGIPATLIGVSTNIPLIFFLILFKSFIQESFVEYSCTHNVHGIL